VVTGSASGLGRALRRRLTAEGFRVIGVDLEGEDVSADLGTPQGRVKAMNAVLAMTNRVIDALVLCAGLGVDDAPVTRLLAVNYYGSVEVLDGLRPGLAGGTNPSAVAVVPNTVGVIPVSDAGLVDALNEDGEAVALKHAERYERGDVHGMTKLALARAVRLRTMEWGQSGIRLNVVARGPFPAPPGGSGVTPDQQSFGGLADALPVPLGRRPSPDDIAGIVSFLVGPDASVVHGAVLFADGGADALLRPDHI
jgi:NAD(P)-dependent dehydrogenase (short-subunit alcohol dehydrogenase family)